MSLFKKNDKTSLKPIWFFAVFMSFSAQQLGTAGDTPQRVEVTEVLIQTSAVPILLKSELEKRANQIQAGLDSTFVRNYDTKWGETPLKAGITALKLDFKNTSIKKISPEQIIRESAAEKFEEAPRQKLEETPTTLTYEFAPPQVSLGSVLAAGGNRALGALCTTFQCIHQAASATLGATQTLWNKAIGKEVNPLKASDQHLPAAARSGPLWMVREPRKIKDLEDYDSHLRARHETLENLYAKRAEHLSTSKTLPDFRHVEYEVRIPITELSLYAERGNQRVQMGLDPHKTKDSPQEEVVLRFSLGENGKIIALKAKDSNGHLLTKLSGDQIRITSGANSHWITSFSTSAVDRVIHALSGEQGLLQLVINKGHVLDQLAEPLEKAVDDFVASHVKTRTVDLGIVNDFKLQHLLSQGVSEMRLDTLKELRESMSQVMGALSEKGDRRMAGASESSSEKLKTLVRQSKIAKLEELYSSYSFIVKQALAFVKELRTKRTVEPIKEIKALTSSILKQLEGLAQHSGIQKKKKDALSELILAVQALSYEISQTVHPLEPENQAVDAEAEQKKTKERIVHEVTTALQCINDSTIRIRTYVDRTQAEISKCESHATPSDTELLDDSTLMKVKFNLSSINDLLNLYHKKDLFKLCVLIGADWVKDECFSKETSNKILISSEVPPRMGYDPERNQLFLGLSEVKISTIGFKDKILKLVSDLPPARCYFDLYPCEKEGIASVCLKADVSNNSTEAQKEIGNSWLKMLESSVVNSTLNKLIVHLSGRVQGKEFPFTVPNFLPVHISNIEASATGLEISLTGKLSKSKE